MNLRSAATGKQGEWQHTGLMLVSSLFFFETLTGLYIWLGAFSVANQWAVLVHTVGGLPFTFLFLGYQLRHWRRYRFGPWTHFKLTGYFALAAALIAGVSGLILMGQALFGTRITYGWRTFHRFSTIAVIVSVVPHVLAVVLRDRKARALAAMQATFAAQRRYGLYVLILLAMLICFWGLLAFTYRPPTLQNALPDDYNYLYGADRPFAPSLARTSTNNAFDARTLSGSQSCGRAGCHAEIVREWEVSAHRWAAADPAFRAIQTVMGEQNGPESTRYCGGCHDPISLFSGTKNLFRAELTNPAGLDEGVSCIACHAITETDVKGNANYTITQPERYLFEMGEHEALRAVSDFLIRSYPERHIETLQHRRFKSPEFCAACHKQFIDEEINKVGWVQLQNQYDNWRKSRWNQPDEPEKTIECRECHMPLVASLDPSQGDDFDYNRTPTDGKHRSHRFLGANQYIPAVLELEGADEQIRLTHEWLQGKIDIPEIAEKWRKGPVVPIEIQAPARTLPGEEVAFEVAISNNKAGHDFPTGPLDIIQSWLQVEVTDQDGRPVFSSGDLDAQGFIDPGSFVFKAEPVDQYGKLIDRHNLWDMVGVRFRRSLFPGFSDKATYTFGCPASVVSDTTKRAERQSFQFDVTTDSIRTLHVEARLMYRKINQFLLNQMFGEAAGQSAPVTVLSEASATISVTASPELPATPPDHRLPTQPPSP